MPSTLIDVVERHRKELLDHVDASMRRLIEAYGQIYKRLGAQQDALLAELELLAAGGTRPAREAALRRVEALRNQIEHEVARYAIYADQETERAAREAIGMALDTRMAEIQAAIPSLVLRPRVAAEFNRLNVDAVESMMGFLRDDSPLHERFTTLLGRDVANRVSEKLTEAIALGVNPRKVARDLVREGMGEGLTWALRTSRTAQLWAYREGQRASDIANKDIVDGWVWVAARDNRVCMSCLAMHGTEHSPYEVLNDHYNGRCARVPKVKGVGAPPIPSGEEWFKSLPEERQRKLMGPGMHDAWKAGQFRFKDLSVPYEDKVYGTMRRQAGLKEVLARSKPTLPA